MVGINLIIMIYPIRVFVDTLDLGVVEIQYPARYRYENGVRKSNVIFTSFDLKAEWGAYKLLDRFLDKNGQETMVFQRDII